MHRRTRNTLAVRIAAVLALATSMQAGAVERISVATGGGQGNGQSRDAAISGDGRYVVFESDASTLVANDTNAATDVFVRDRLLGTTTRISLTSTGSQSGAASGSAAISGSGSRIAFTSFGALLPNSNYYNCYLLDRSANTLQILDLRADNGQPGSAACAEPSLDYAGTHAAFATRTPAVAGDNNGWADVFVRNLAANTSVRVNRGPGNVEANADSAFPRLSGDASQVTFSSDASNLVNGDSNAQRDIFIAPANGNGPVTRVNVGPGNVQAENGGFASEFSALNADGSLLAFSSKAHALPDWGPVAQSTLYLRVPSLDATLAISIPEGASPREGFNDEPDFDYSGRWLTFVSTDQLYSGAEAGGVYVVDLIAATIVQVSVGGNSSNVHQPRLSADGTGVVWHSYSATQVPGDTNGTWDVFYADNPLWVEPPIFADGFDG
jgi:Tol biopolymer transport system component